MDVTKLTVDRKQARELYREYKKHQHYSEPIDDEIRRAYQLIAQGRMVIQAMESIRAAGLGENGLPKLAIARADTTQCFCRLSSDGSATFGCHEWNSPKSARFALPKSSFPEQRESRRGKAIVPIVPVHLRPKRGIQNYQILWEADWERVPVDPLLLRRIGKGDMWLVVAAWDLTEVERAALATRMSS